MLRRRFLRSCAAALVLPVLAPRLSADAPPPVATPATADLAALLTPTDPHAWWYEPLVVHGPGVFFVQTRLHEQDMLAHVLAPGGYEHLHEPLPEEV